MLRILSFWSTSEACLTVTCVTESIILEGERSYFLKLRMTERVEWVWESLLHYHHFSMKMSCLLCPLYLCSWQLNSLISWVALKGLQERVKKLVISLNMLSNLLLEMLFRNRLLISQNVAIMSTFFWELVIESLIFCLKGIGYVHNTDKYKVKHVRKRIEILLVFFFTTWLSLHEVLIRGKPASFQSWRVECTIKGCV